MLLKIMDTSFTAAVSDLEISPAFTSLHYNSKLASYHIAACRVD